MKILLPALFVVALATFTACKKKPDTSRAAALNPESAKTFDETAAHLDAGGDFYLYLRTEQILGRVPAFLDEWKASLVEMAGQNDSTSAEQVEAWYAVGRKAILDTGLLEVRSFGLSSIQLEPDLSRTKSAILTTGPEKSGLVWRLYGNRPPHALEALDMLPASTIYTAFSDFDAAALYTYVMQIVDSLPDPAMQEKARQFPAMAETALGMPPAEFFASLGSEFGFVITADESATMTIPSGGTPVELPKMALAILFRVSDDKLYDLLTKKVDETVGKMLPPTKSDVDGVRTVTIPVPVQGLPLAPTIARFGDYVAISTSPELVTALARKGENPPALLKDTPEFRRFTSLEKMEGNGFGYLSETGSALLRKFQMQSIDAEGDIPPALRKNIEKLYTIFSQRFLFSIARNNPDAATSVMYSPNGSKQIVAAAAIAPAAIVGAIAFPAIAEAQAKAAALAAPQIQVAPDLPEPDETEPVAP